MGDDKKTLIEIKPPGYLPERSTPSRPRKPRVVVDFECRRLARSDPDPQTPLLTGRYEEDDADFTLNINQAGKHLECWMAEVLTARERHRPKRMIRTAGDREADGSFTIYAVDTPGKVLGKLTSDGVGSGVTLTIDGVGTSHFVAVNKLPTMSEKAMKQLPDDQQIIRAFEWAWLPRRYVQWINEHLNAEKIIPYLAGYYAIGTGVGVVEQRDRALVARHLAAYIGEVFSTDPPDGWHPEDLLLARHFGQQALALQRWTREGVKRSLLDWIQLMLSQVASYRLWDKGLENLRNHLNLQAETDLDPNSPGHTYEVEIMAAGLSGDAGIGLGGFVGGINIKKTTEPAYENNYDFWMGGVSGGASVGIGMGFWTSGSGTSRLSWAPGDFPGWYTMVDGGAHGGVGAGAGLGGTAMMIYGSGNLPPLAVDLSGVTWKSEIAAGVEVGGSFGRIGDLKSISGGFKEEDALHVKVNDDYAVDADHEDRVHFRLGSALLNPAAWQILRVFCAKELSALVSAGSRLEIVGHADRRDTAERNVELTKLRARNTLQALRDILGNQFQIQEDHIRLVGMGEQGAEEAGDRDRTQNPAWRKVQVILNSRLVVTLRG